MLNGQGMTRRVQGRPAGWRQRCMETAAALLRRPRRWLQALWVPRVAAFADSLCGVDTATPATMPPALTPVAPRRHALSRLLDQHGQARRTLRALSFVERQLIFSGEAGLAFLSRRVLEQAGQQLQQLTDLSEDGRLAELHALLHELALLHEPAPPATGSDQVHVRLGVDLLESAQSRGWVYGGHLEPRPYRPTEPMPIGL
jgi:hypothetical protein